MVQIFNTCVGLSQKVLCTNSVYVNLIIKIILVRVHIWLGFTHFKGVDYLIYRYIGLSDHIRHFISQHKFFRLKLAKISKREVKLMTRLHLARIILVLPHLFSMSKRLILAFHNRNVQTVIVQDCFSFGIGNVIGNDTSK